jgi:hypothetical protein
VGLGINLQNQKEKMNYLTNVLRNLKDDDKVLEVTLALSQFNADETIARLQYDAALSVAFEKLNGHIDRAMGWG